MSRPSTAREALIVEAIGDVARLLDRVESLAPVIDGARRALGKTSDDFAHQVKAFEGRLAAMTEHAKAKAIEHIAQCADDAARRSTETQTRAMSNAARVLFHTEIGAALQRLSTSLQRSIERLDRPWELWLTHAATAVTSSAFTWALTTYFLRR